MPFLALGAVDAVALILAVVGFAILGAFWPVFKLLEAITRHIPVIGGPIANVFGGFAQAEMKLANVWLDGVVHPLAHLFMALGNGLWWILHQLGLVHAHVNAKANNAQAGAQAAQSTANSAISQLPAIAAQAARSAVSQAEAASEAYTNGQVGAFESQLQSAVAGQDAQLQSLQSQVGALAGANAAGLASVTATLEGEIANVKTDVISEANTLFGEAEAAISGLADQVAAIPADIAGAIDNVVPGDIAKALAAAGVLAIPGLLSSVGAITTEITECLEPLCDTVTPQAPRLGRLGQLFAELEQLGIEALIVALAAECLTDPGAVAADLDAVVTDVGQPIMAGFRDLIGV